MVSYIKCPNCQSHDVPDPGPRRDSGGQLYINVQPTAEAYARTLLMVFENSVKPDVRNWAQLEIERIFRVAAITGGFKADVESHDMEPIERPA